MRLRLIPAALLALLLTACVDPGDAGFGLFEPPPPQPPVELPASTHLAVLDSTAGGPEIAFLDEVGVEVARLVVDLDRRATSLDLHPEGFLISDSRRAWVVGLDGEADRIYESPGAYLWSVTSGPEGGFTAAEEFVMTAVGPDGVLARYTDELSCFMDMVRSDGELLVADVWGPRLARWEPEAGLVETAVSWEADDRLAWMARAGSDGDGGLWIGEQLDTPRLLVADPGAAEARTFDFAAASGVDPWAYHAVVPAADDSVYLVVESDGGSGIYRAWRSGLVVPVVEDLPAVWLDAVRVEVDRGPSLETS